jgi:hypothetical protein
MPHTPECKSQRDGIAYTAPKYTPYISAKKSQN